jgi:hypothetical protein
MFSRSPRVLFRGLRIRKFSSENSDQEFTIPTRDSAFKYILVDDKIRDSFFHAFIPDINIKSSTRIDDHMNPIEKLQILRTFLNSKTNKTIASKMRKSDFNVMKRVSKEKFVPDLEFSKFVRDLLRFYNHISDSFPEQLYGGKMDFACQLENKDYVLVEMQVIPSDDWDRRALAYISAFYGNQLRRGGQWNNLKKVIGVNILGGSRDDKMVWSNRKPCDYMRHFKCQNQVSGNTDIFIDAVELFQYSLISPPPSSISIEAKDWLTFLSRAAFMTEEDVKREIKTPEVLLAFDRAKISQLPTQVLEAYQAETSKFQMYSQYTADLVLEGKLGEKFEIAQRMISMSFDDSVIIKTTGLSHADLTIIKDSLS